MAGWRAAVAAERYRQLAPIGLHLGRVALSAVSPPITGKQQSAFPSLSQGPDSALQRPPPPPPPPPPSGDFSLPGTLSRATVPPTGCVSCDSTHTAQSPSSRPPGAARAGKVRGWAGVPAERFQASALGWAGPAVSAEEAATRAERNLRNATHLANRSCPSLDKVVSLETASASGCPAPGDDPREGYSARVHTVYAAARYPSQD
ncbi:B3 domain-containing protein LFL1-like [Schistocerca piceifrons]|uniref:B3 domain-containing protein LFL1-like n=1 Tax=Schistocerca piceifrons TaxID=274613 RepID=UPI001F5F3DAE|nr:B3 domain-containing protein LFL1-like [Schistocerca piceifrons]